MRKQKSFRQAGHTLVEVMLALFMLTVCTIIFGSTLPAAFESRAKADNYNMATSLAQKQLEAIRSVGFDNCSASALASRGLIDSSTPVSTDTFSFTSVDNGIVDSPSSVLTSGIGRLTIETLATDLRRLTVTVQWTEQGVSRTVRVASLLADV